jgi:cell division protein FtsI/penicillin-binding protein 2
MVVFFAALVIRLFNVQVLKSDELKYFARRQQMASEKVKSERGLIYDRNGLLLVYTKNDVSFYLDLRMVSKKDKKRIAEKFASTFSESPNYFYELMKDSGKTICLEKKVPNDKAIALKSFKANGLFFREDPSVVYYYKNLASHVLGYVDGDYKGVDGIAKSCDDLLAGEDGSMMILRDAIGDMITVSEEETKPAIPGSNIYLTIDKTYQAVVEEELKDGLQKYGGSSAVGIIMDPNNGQILALANAGDYDPNEYWKFSDSLRRDRAVTDTYEPGSTFKTFTMASLLDENKCNLNEQVYAENGKYKFKNVNITDSHRSQWLTVRGVLEQSSNIGMAKLSQRIDDDSFYKYLRGFGFGNVTSINLPGEVKGTLRKPNEWGEVSKSFISFGYGITVTPIQLITAYSAIVNGGMLYQPQIIEKEVKRDGQTIFQSSPVKVRQVISEATSKRMRDLLVGVVKNGTGTNAQLESVSVGGKTGTSQKLVNGKYSKQDYNSSFVGFFPADAPKIVCLVLVNSPENGRYGGLVAAPIFKNIAQRIVNANPGNFENSPQNREEHIQKQSVQVASNSKNNNVQNQTVVKKVDTTKLIASVTNSKKMPDLKDFQVRDAILVLSKLGLKYKVNGSGIVIAQSIQVGDAIHKGLYCVLDCKETVVSGAVVY